MSETSERATAPLVGSKSAFSLVDMHCHLDFAADAPAFAYDLFRQGIGAFSTTVDPDGYEQSLQALAACPNVRVGAGLHPWWLSTGRCGYRDVERLEALVPQTPFVGEIGLDFGACHSASADIQLAAFARTVRACARAGGRVISIHAVRSVDAVLDVLEQEGCLADNACIIHWFSGSSDQLQRAIRLGCYISLGQRSLATKRGRAYAQVIPLTRLLLETDLPESEPPAKSADSLYAALRDAADRIAALRGPDARATMAQTSCNLLNLSADPESR